MKNKKCSHCKKNSITDWDMGICDDCLSIKNNPVNKILELEKRIAQLEADNARTHKELNEVRWAG